MGEGKGGITWDPSLPMGRRGLRWWERGGRDRRISPPVRMREDDKVLSPRSSPHVQKGLIRVGEDGVGVVVRGPGFEERVRSAIVG